ncbi:efflux RND transporter periplasmic adaptor subunit [Vallitaleaceae bacterium 9-2]|jgi:RND family efflux transporter MFP subunit
MKKNQRHIKNILVLGCIFLLMGCAKHPNAQIVDKKTVGIETVDTTVSAHQVTMSGNVKPVETMKLSFELAGVVENVLFEEGERIQTGDVIAKLDTVNYQLAENVAQADLHMAGISVNNAQLQYEIAKAEYEAVKLQADTEIPSKIEQAKAQYDLLETNYQRMQELYDEGAVAKSELEQMLTKYTVAKETYQQALDAQEITQVKLNGAKQKVDAYALQINASVEQENKAQNSIQKASNDMEDTFLKSPIEGVILKKVVNTNETVSAGYPIVVVGRTDQMYVEFGVSDAYINKIKKGQKVAVKVYASDQLMEGSIEQIGMMSDPATRMFPVKVLLDNKDEMLKAGMIVEVALELNEEDVVLVPIEAVIRLSAADKVFIYNKENETVEERIVKTGEILEDRIQILEGLDTGEILVVEGNFLLNDGDKVLVEGGEDSGEVEY